MLDLFTLFSASGLAGDLDICRKSEEYQERGNIFNDTPLNSEKEVEAVAQEAGFLDETLNIFNGLVARMLSGLPEISSVDLSMEQAKGKGQ